MGCSAFSTSPKEGAPHLACCCWAALRAERISVTPNVLRLRVSRPCRWPPTDPAELDRVSIPVERIGGPVLLLSAGADRNWPSAAYSQVAADRLTGHPHRVEHRVFSDAGHSIAGSPAAPFTSTLSPGPGVTFEMGGSPTANTRARAECWTASTRFLTESLLP